MFVNRLWTVVLVVVLTGLIVGGVYLCWRVAFSQPQRPPAPTPQDEVDFLCALCGHQFVKRTKELPPGYLIRRLRDTDGTGIDCPQCGKKKCADVSVLCPSCEKPYLVNASLWYMGIGGHAPTTNDQPTCSHCGTNLIEHYRKHGRTSPRPRRRR